MSVEKLNLKQFLENNVLLEKKKKKKKKKTKSRKKNPYGKGGLDDGWFSHGAPHGTSGYDGGATGAGGSSGVGESLIVEILAGITPAAFSANMNSITAFSKNDNNPETGMTTKDPAMTNYPSEEEVEVKANKVDQARQIFQSMINQKDAKRSDILNAFIENTGVTNSTAISYYTRFLDEFGMGGDDAGDNALGQGVDMGSDDASSGGSSEYGEPIIQQDSEEDDDINQDDHEKTGIIRTVDNAHLVYKKQSENGSYEELWIYNIHNETNDELDVRRDILAGTDIPKNKTKSADGVQSYSIYTVGNAQYLHIKNLPN